jgi:hypothetical protein
MADGSVYQPRREVPISRYAGDDWLQLKPVFGGFSSKYNAAWVSGTEMLEVRYFKPLNNVGAGQPGIPGYHAYLIYTAPNGVQYYLRGSASESGGKGGHTRFRGVGHALQ